MLVSISEWLIDKILNDTKDEQQRALCIYGCTIWLYTIFSTCGLLAVGYVSNNIVETIVMVCIFYIVQTIGGGYHADTHIKCFTIMVIGLIIGLVFIHLSLSLFISFIILVASFIELLCFPLCLHQNKWYLSEQSSRLKTKSRCLTVCIFIIIVGIILLEGKRIAKSCCVAMCMSAVSRLYAIYKKDIC